MPRVPSNGSRQLQVCAQQQGGGSSSSSSRVDDMLHLLERWTLDEDSAKYAKVLRVQRELEDDLQAAQQQLAALKAGHDEIRAMHAQAQVERMKAEVERVKAEVERVKRHVQRVKEMEDLFKKRINDKKGEIRNARHERWRTELTGPGNGEAVAAAETKVKEKERELAVLEEQKKIWRKQMEEERKNGEEERKKWQQQQQQHKVWVRALTTLLQAAGEPLPHTTSAEHLWTVVSQVVDDALATAWEAGLVPAAGPPRLATITLSALQAIEKRVAEKKISSPAAIRDAHNTFACIVVAFVTATATVIIAAFVTVSQLLSLAFALNSFFTTPPSSITKPEKNPYLVYWPDNAQFFTDIWREPLAKQFELKADDITPQAVIAKIHEIPVLEVSSSRGPRPRGRQVTLGLRQGLPLPKALPTGWSNEAEMCTDIAEHLRATAAHLDPGVTFPSEVPIMTFKPGTRPKTDIVMVDRHTNTIAAVFELKLGEDADSLGQLAAYAHHAIVANVLCIAGEHVPLEELPLLAGLAMFGLRVSPVQTTVVEFMVANAGGVVKVVAHNIISMPTKNIGQAALAISCFADFLHAKYAHAIKQNTKHGSDFALNVMKPHVLHFNPDSGKAEAPKVLSSVANKGSGYVCKFIKTGHRAGDLCAEEIENMWKYVNGQRACSRIPATNSTATTNSKSSTTNTTSSNIISSSGNDTQMIAVPHLGSTRAHIHEQHVVQLCNSLFLLSAAGLVHHDIRCANVVVSGDKASLIDFELAGCDADVMEAAELEPAEVALRTDLPERAPQMAHRATKDAMLAALEQLEQQQQQQQGKGKQGEKEKQQGHVVLVGMNPTLPQSCDLLGRIKKVIKDIPLYD
ncbi:serine/threonine protein kinase [Salpingoeca rosetta]|uniref:Serine/threonine protein kinase n=1 Tax=Salpingoeca rosetta (strain ATCC 50818 / BSB-021) TaxID=946362 RepID=F2UPT8_SALR5|nr:serine/threonine protein kinase [Salpingoeca rosetta]EGD79643.1 serine/threonine protein kinase [Salpingoeca rosetta]|eukprot:XP_004988871.1 serine/threonine protein kinase [Salpingoeca rosetta]